MIMCTPKNVRAHCTCASSLGPAIIVAGVVCWAWAGVTGAAASIMAVVHTAVHILLAVIIALVIAGVIVVARLVFAPRRTRLTHAVATTTRHVHEHDRPGTAQVWTLDRVVQELEGQRPSQRPRWPDSPALTHQPARSVVAGNLAAARLLSEGRGESAHALPGPRRSDVLTRSSDGH